MHPDGGSTVHGFFSGSATFGQGEPGVATITSSGESDIYTARYSSEGNLLWVKRAGGTGADIGVDIAKNSDNSVIVTGYFSGASLFGQGESNQTSLVSKGLEDIYMAKYNANGTLAWARRAGGTGSDSGRAVDVSIDGSILFSGYFQSLSDFGQGGLNIQELTSIGNIDSFIAKYNENGTLN
jgi:hypothetical protein